MPLMSGVTSDRSLCVGNRLANLSRFCAAPEPAGVSLHPASRGPPATAAAPSPTRPRNFRREAFVPEFWIVLSLLLEGCGERVRTLE